MSMGLNFTINPLTTTRLPQAEMVRRFHQKDGHFDHFGQSYENCVIDPQNRQICTLTISFAPTIFLNDQLSDNYLRTIQTHEQQHYQDFQRLAFQLRGALRRECARATVDWRPFWDWFLYDLCVAFREYHRRIGAMVQICSQPSVQRPVR